MRLFPCLLLFALATVAGLDAAPRTADDFADEYDNRVTRTIVRYQSGQAATAAYYSRNGALETMEFYSAGILDSVHQYEQGGTPTERRLINRDGENPGSLTVYSAEGIEQITDPGKIDSILNGPPTRSPEHVSAVLVRNRNVLNGIFHRYFGRDPLRQGPVNARIRVLSDGSVDRAVLMTKDNPGRDFYAELLKTVRAMQFDPVPDAAPSTLTIRIEFAQPAGAPLSDKPKISRTKQVVLSVVGVITISSLVWVFLNLNKKTS